MNDNESDFKLLIIGSSFPKLPALLPFISVTFETELPIVRTSLVSIASEFELSIEFAHLTPNFVYWRRSKSNILHKQL